MGLIPNTIHLRSRVRGQSPYSTENDDCCVRTLFALLIGMFNFNVPRVHSLENIRHMPGCCSVLRYVFFRAVPPLLYLLETLFFVIPA